MRSTTTLLSLGQPGFSKATKPFIYRGYLFSGVDKIVPTALQYPWTLASTGNIQKKQKDDGNDPVLRDRTLSS
jgi:hypothetical protein